MGMSGMYGPADRDESIATIHAALDAGITLLDTGDFYGMGHNELLIARRARATATATTCIISVKFGALRDPAGGWGGVRHAARRRSRNFARLLAARGSARTTSTSTAPRGSIPTSRSRRPSGAIDELVEAGYVRHIGLSEVGARRSAAPPPSTRSPTCRSSTR